MSFFYDSVKYTLPRVNNGVKDRLKDSAIYYLISFFF